MSPETQSTWLNGACQMPGTMISCLVGAGGVRVGGDDGVDHEAIRSN